MLGEFAIPAPATEKPGSECPGQMLESVLLAARLLTDEGASRARLAAAESNEKLVVVISRLGLAPERAMAEALARASGFRMISAQEFPDKAVLPDRLSSLFLRENRALPLWLGDGRAGVAVADPYDPFVGHALRFVLGVPLEICVASASDIEAAVVRLYGEPEAGPDRDDGDNEVDEDDVERLKDLVSDAPVIRAVNRLIAEAVDCRASDIHVEPTEDRLAIRFRVDGVLAEREPLPSAMRMALVSRIKVMAGLNLAERRLPQDGRMKVAIRGHDMDLRVATAPTIHGESVVMRILDRSSLALDFATLGFDDGLAAQIRTAIHRPHGIVLVTGPTGSGKTTTLYAALAELNTSERKLLTVEDPIEYRLPGVAQTQVNPQIGFTFGAALRSFLRLDPDAMMVGEIRDGETAQIAVQAALTGHMILSTLHTNSAAGAVTRLLDMGVEPFLLSSVLTGVLAQRLVRRLCQHCREAFEPSPELLRDLGQTWHDSGLFYRAKGCPACGHSGYSGRIALMEYLPIDDAVSRLILARADTRDIAAAASESGMRSIRSDGLVKARAGLTSVEEAVRATVES